MKNRVTMADIAKRAGVHTTTVSMALRNHRNLPSQTIERIRKLAVEMGYYPDPALQALVSYRHEKKIPKINATLAYLTNWDTEDGWREHTAQQRFFTGAREHAERLGYKLDHFWLRDLEPTSKRLNDILQTRGIRGLIVASFPPEPGVELNLEWSRFAGIKIDYYPRRIPLHCVTNDQQSIIHLAFQKILEKGYRRIGIVMPRVWDDYVNNSWSVGYLAAQQQLRPRERIPAMVYDVAVDHGKEDRQIRVPGELLESWLSKYRPEVILSYYPYIYDSLKEIGLTMGEDIGFVDLFLDKADGSIAGIVNQCEQVSRVAIEILVGQIQRNVLGLPPTQMKTLIQGVWVDGATLK